MARLDLTDPIQHQICATLRSEFFNQFFRNEFDHIAKGVEPIEIFASTRFVQTTIQITILRVPFEHRSRIVLRRRLMSNVKRILENSAKSAQKMMMMIDHCDRFPSSFLTDRSHALRQSKVKGTEGTSKQKKIVGLLVYDSSFISSAWIRAKVFDR